MSDVVDCSGSTRDLGLDQGQACRGAIRDAVARAGVAGGVAWRPWRIFGARVLPGSDPAARVANAVLRHYPHLAERVEGLARGAGLPRTAIFELLAGWDAEAIRDVGLWSSPAAHARPSLAAALAPPAAPGGRWVLRRSAPEVGYRSAELTLPWLVSAVAGVNEKGLAAAYAPGADAARRRDVGGPPPILLVQECLQRFAGIDAAVDWCLRRPSAGGGSVTLLAAAGRAVVVDLEPASRGVREAGGNGVATGGDEGWTLIADPAARRIDLARGDREKGGSLAI